jgi:hypothetical protein
MNNPALESSRYLQRQAASLLLYQDVLADEIGQAFLQLLRAIAQGTATHFEALQAYGRWFHALATASKSWEETLLDRLLAAENPFTQQAQQYDFNDLSPSLVAAAKQDLQVLQYLYNCDGDKLGQWIQTAYNLTTPPVVYHNSQNQIPEYQKSIRETLIEASDWGETVPTLAAYYRRYGTGIFAQYRALRWESGEFQGIPHPDPVRLTDLVGYEFPKETLIKNTEFLLAGYAALHVILYGSRGSGKSSLVKALANEYGDRGLRLIEVPKADLNNLPDIVNRLWGCPQKFIIFVDDLSFEEDDDAFKALKVVLEGSLHARPQNVVVYATSNRRHLVREFFAERPQPSSQEVHAWDTQEEKLSFSDRFGLTLTFEPADQNTYLEIVRNLAKQADISLAAEDLESRALQWATRHNGRSGRTARQFIDFLQAELATQSSSE